MTVAIACQGGGSHTAFTAGALGRLLPAVDRSPAELVGLSGTSGGAFAAVTGWYGLLEPGADPEVLLTDLWDDIAASGPFNRTMNNALVWTSALEAMGVPVPEPSPYWTTADDAARRQLRRTLEAHVDFERFPALATGDAPTLVVGAVDISDGEFVTFTDEAVTAAAVLASAAVPGLYEAVEIDGDYHWDGLLSQNPPIRPHFEGPVGSKPDELWVVQVSPQSRDERPRSPRAISDRRSELAGNLSLNQELRFVEKVNDWVETGRLRDGYKHTAVRRIQLDRELSLASRYDRRPSFVADLFEDGAATATAFLADRGYTSTSTS